MPRYNTKFELDLKDMELIETALRKAATDRVEGLDARDVQDLLGRLHNQKVFYRPSGPGYVSG